MMRTTGRLSPLTRTSTVETCPRPLLAVRTRPEAPVGPGATRGGDRDRGVPPARHLPLPVLRAARPLPRLRRGRAAAKAPSDGAAGAAAVAGVGRRDHRLRRRASDRGPADHRRGVGAGPFRRLAGVPRRRVPGCCSARGSTASRCGWRPRSCSPRPRAVRSPSGRCATSTSAVKRATSTAPGKDGARACPGSWARRSPEAHKRR